MSRFRCTVEYRLNNGSIHHDTRVFDAGDGHAAAEMARQAWVGEHEPGPDGETGEVEEIVCMVVEDDQH